VAESLASQAAVVLNNRMLNERHNQLMRFKRELEIGRQIQLSFLPAQLPSPTGWDVAALFRPALEVAGDFYDAFLLPHGYLAVVIADVVGKGVMAALFMAIIRSLYRALFQQNYIITESIAAPPDAGLTAPFPFVDRGALLRAVQLTNAYLINNHSDTYAFATLFAGVLDPGSGRLIYVNAGHNPPFVLARTGGGRAIRQELAPTGPAVGLILAADYHLGETTLYPGDLLFAYTDGVTDARDPGAEEFGLERLKDLLTSGATSAEETLATIETALRAHTAVAEAFDDVTMLALRRATNPTDG
jgi:serine phosphatase RsbU (regulator of sigma subunit)